MIIDACYSGAFVKDRRHERLAAFSTLLEGAGFFCLASCSAERTSSFSSSGSHFTARVCEALRAAHSKNGLVRLSKVVKMLRQRRGDAPVFSKPWDWLDQDWAIAYIEKPNAKNVIRGAIRASEVAQIVAFARSPSHPGDAVLKAEVELFASSENQATKLFLEAWNCTNPEHVNSAVNITRLLYSRLPQEAPASVAELMETHHGSPVILIFFIVHYPLKWSLNISVLARVYSMIPPREYMLRDGVARRALLCHDQHCSALVDDHVAQLRKTVDVMSCVHPWNYVSCCTILPILEHAYAGSDYVLVEQWLDLVDATELAGCSKKLRKGWAKILLAICEVNWRPLTRILFQLELPPTLICACIELALVKFTVRETSWYLLLLWYLFCPESFKEARGILESHAQCLPAGLIAAFDDISQRPGFHPAELIWLAELIRANGY